MNMDDTPAGMGYWLDHEGKLLGPGPLDNPTGFGKYDRLTHRIMKPQRGQLMQAVSWCGHRVHEVPGHGDVDCPECLELLAESDAGTLPDHDGHREDLRRASAHRTPVGSAGPLAAHHGQARPVPPR